MIEVKQVSPRLAKQVHQISEACLHGEGWSLAQYEQACEDGNLFYDGFTVYTYRYEGKETVTYVE